MILFYLKKNFCDGWDNFLFLALFNFVMLLLTLGVGYAVYMTSMIPILSISIMVVGTSLIMIPFFSISDTCAAIADFKSVALKEVLLNCKNVWKNAVLFGIFVSILLFTVFVGIPFYFTMHVEQGNILWLILGSILLWFVVITVFALQWFMPLCSQLGGGFRKNLKKCYILLFDNLFFTLFLGIYSVFLAVVSALLVFLAPGISGIILAHNNALRLRLYKYDWIEENPEIAKSKRKIPWDELIAEDQDTIGPRNLRSFIFPWK